MIATLIGAGLAVGSSIWGGINASKAARKANRMLQGQKDSNNAWYRRRYNEDYADTAAGQRLITQAKDYAKESWKKAQGAAKVGGATDESAALAKEAGNKMVGNTISSIAASDTARKDRIDTAHRTTDNALTSQQVAIERDRANQITKAASQASNAMINAGAYIDGLGASNVSDSVKSFSIGDVTKGVDVVDPLTGKVVNSEWLKREMGMG